MFVAGEKAYVSLVIVTITNAKGAMLVKVPAEEVTGPWLFVDLPSGTYLITGKLENQAKARVQVQVSADRQKIVVSPVERRVSSCAIVSLQ